MQKLVIERAIDWRDEDVEHVREQRKFFANYEQTPDLDKQTRKLCQRYVKATTLVLEHMTGMKGGKWEGETLDKQVHIPLELEDTVRGIFAMTDNRQNYGDVFK